MARVFDVVDRETGPGFAPEHPLVGDRDEWQALLDYLESGTPVLVTPTLLDDVVDPARTAVVPAGFRTDGTWVWTDTVAYYLRYHGLAPEERLLAHLREQDRTAAPVDADTTRRALGFVLRAAAGDRSPVRKTV
ncbi:hypothetical protein ADL03_30540 [Nocardia sp. NRRL S-836]|nr:hypothetical protein ADL03_30540 [Nocardia sp. NRRL S-836]